MNRHVTIVGEAPARGTSKPFGSCGSAYRLQKLTGVEDLDSVFVLRNLFDLPVGKWPRAEARKLASSKVIPTPVVLLAGRNVARAFGVPRDVPFFEPVLTRGQLTYVIPHPSGRSHWWNVPEHVEQAREFFQHLMFCVRLKGDAFIGTFLFAGIVAEDSGRVYA